MKFALPFIAAAIALLGCKALADDAATTQPYQVFRCVTVGGVGGWDYITVDCPARWLYVPRGDRVTVYDADIVEDTNEFPLDDCPCNAEANAQAREQIGEIPGAAGVHDVAIDPGTAHGFTSNGGDATVTLFDANTLGVIDKIRVAGVPDRIFFEPASKRIFIESRKSPNLTALNPADGSVLGMIDLGGAPAQSASDGKGHVYINLQDANEIVVVDPNALKVTARWKLGEGQGPAGLALDAKNRRLFSCCHNGKMVILDSGSGRIVATVPIGRGADAAAFSPDTLEAFSSGGDGTLTVVKEDSPASFAVEQNLTTQIGARTCALDRKTGNIILVSAEYAPPATAAGRQPRTIVPDTFNILVIGRAQ